ncbi:MAG: hypothetical protein AB7K24_21535 [Gemmataceae bacterium]
MRYALPAVFCCVLLAATRARCEEKKPALERGLDYLVRAQEKDGSFAPNEFGRQFRPGITGLCVLALLARGEEQYDRAARQGLDYLAARAQPGHMYAHALATLALAEGAARWKDDYFKPAERAVKQIIAAQNKNGGWGYAADPKSSRTESCMSGLVLHALFAARQAGIDVPEETRTRALDFLRKQYDPKRAMFNNETYVSPSYGATGLAVAALARFGESDAESVRNGLAYLDKLPVEKITVNLKGRPFSGYARGHYHFELFGHALAYRQAGKQPEKWSAQVADKLTEQCADEGAWDGWFGKPYGTALACLILQLDGKPALVSLKK